MNPRIKSYLSRLDTRYYKRGLLQVNLILEHHIYYFRYLSYFIQSAIDIIYRYRSRKPMSIEIILFHKTLVDKNSDSFRVDQSMY